MLAEEQVDRYELLGELATGGMATVYLGRQHGPFGFARTVAIKSMHPQFAKDDGFRTMFLDEATLTARIRHPNVVPTLDIVCASTKLLLVMEYIDGVSLSALLGASRNRKIPIPPAVSVAIVCDALHGLHAAHEFVGDDGQHLAVVHRDVSPQNIHVGVDGLARVLDFGVAKATSQRYVTRTNEVKGKIAYMSPEQLCGEALDRRTDIYAAGVVLWEALTGHRLFAGASEGEVVKKVIEGKVDPPSFLADEPLSAKLDRVVVKALALKAEDRWATTEEMALALADAIVPASRPEVSHIVSQLAGPELAARSERLRVSASGSHSIQLEAEERALAEILTAQATLAAMTSVKRPIARGRQAMTLAGSLLLIAALTGGAFIVGSRSARGKTDGPPQDPASGPTSPPSATSSIEVPPTPTSASQGTKPTPSLDPPLASAPTTNNSVRPRPPKKVPTVSSRPRPGVDCRVPYTVDVHGDRHYKAECVE